MIQRLQSVFLFNSVILLVILMLIHIAEFSVGGAVVYLDSYQFSINTGEQLAGTQTIISLVALVDIVACLNLIIIFLFKKRALQMRLCIVSIGLQIILAGVIAFYCFVSAPGEFVQFKFGAFILLISIILTYISWVNIRKDDNLIKSLNRIR